MTRCPLFSSNLLFRASATTPICYTLTALFLLPSFFRFLTKKIISELFSFSLKMSEKLCLKWNKFEENVNRAFGMLREDKDLTDVTLACEDGQQVEAHKVMIYLYYWLTKSS